MKERISINELDNYSGKDVSISGYVESVRDQKNMQFLILRDRSGTVQITNEKKGGPLEEIISSITPGSTANVYGNVVSNERVKLRGLEIKPYKFEITSSSLGPSPIDEDSSLEKRLDYRHIDLRRPKNQLIFKVQTEVERAMRSYWLDHGFLEIHSPKLVEGATESGAELFKLDYFGKEASLAQSPQFYKQMAMAAGFEKVFEIGPVFRANPSHTSRHDTEFTSVDMEMSYIDSHEDVIGFEEGWVQNVLENLKSKYGKDIEDYFGVDIKIPSIPFPRITMENSYKILNDEFNYKIPDDKGDLNPQAERFLSKYIKEKYNHEFVFVTEYPWSARPFYHMKKEDDKNLTKSFDLLWKGIEITTGAQREHRYDILKSQAEEKNVNPNSIQSYLEFFKYGCPPHGGFGFGLTRMMMNLLEVGNVREVTFLPRDTKRLTP